MVRMGLCYHYGRGVGVNLSEAVRCYQRAADKDYPLGHYMLGAWGGYRAPRKLESCDINATPRIHRAMLQDRERFFTHLFHHQYPPNARTRS